MLTFSFLYTITHHLLIIRNIENLYINPMGPMSMRFASISRLLCQILSPPPLRWMYLPFVYPLVNKMYDHKGWCLFHFVGKRVVFVFVKSLLMGWRMGRLGWLIWIMGKRWKCSSIGRGVWGLWVTKI